MAEKIMIRLFGKQICVDTNKAFMLEYDCNIDTTLKLSMAVNNDDADTMLRLSMINVVPKNITIRDDQINLAAKFCKEIIDKSSFLGLGINDSSRNYKTNDCHHHKKIALNPIPLRSYNPTYGCMDHASSQDDTDKGSIGSSGSTDHQGSTCSGKKKSPKRKQKNITSIDNGNKEGKKKRSRSIKYSEPNINLSCEFLQIIGTTRPFFLYRKKLEECDVKKSQNRLIVTETDKLMEFLTEEERRDSGVNGKPVARIDLIGVDRMGREYKLHLTKWGKINVIIKEWSKMVVENGAKAGDWVHLWDYRRDDRKFRLAVQFHQ